MQIAQMKKDDRFEGFLLVRSAEQRTSNANGSKYLDLTLSDRSGEINAKMWDGVTPPPPSGSVIKVRALVQEYNGRLQLRIERLRAAAETDPVRYEDLTRVAPEPPRAMLAEIRETVDGMAWEALKKLMHALLDLTEERLLYYPAAQRLHHAERGGLLHHTVSMLRTAKAVLPVYPFLNADLLCAGVIAHDLSKTTELMSDEMGIVPDYTVSGMLLGHLVEGTHLVNAAAAKAGVEGEECVLLLNHMLISHHGVPEFGSPKAPMFPEAEALHMIDDLDAKMNQMEEVMLRTPPGVFSEKIWAFDRRLYHPRYPGEEELPFDPAPISPAKGGYDGLL